MTSKERMRAVFTGTLPDAVTGHTGNSSSGSQAMRVRRQAERPIRPGQRLRRTALCSSREHDGRQNRNYQVRMLPLKQPEPL